MSIFNYEEKYLAHTDLIQYNRIDGVWNNVPLYSVRDSILNPIIGKYAEFLNKKKTSIEKLYVLRPTSNGSNTYNLAELEYSGSGGGVSSWNDLLDKPDTLLGFGITDGVSLNLFNNHINNQGDQKHLSSTQLNSVLQLLSFWSLDEDGNLFTNRNLYSTGEIAAYSLGISGGGGGSDYERLDTWADYDSSKSGWVLSALLGNDLNTRVTNLENSGGGGGGGSTVEWGTLTNGYRQLTVEGVTYGLAQNTHTHLWADITDKPSAFTPSAHSHGWSEITGKPSTFAPSAHTHAWADITSKPSTFAPSAHTHSAGDITTGTFAIARIPTGTTASTVALGNHLHTGTYEPVFSKNTAFNKDFGTTSGTVAQGNDSRITNGQTAYGWGNHASAGYALNSSLSSYVAKTDSVYIGTTAVPLNRTSGTLDLSGIGTLTAAKVKVDLLSFDKSGNYVGIYDDGEGLPIIAGNTSVMSTYLNYGNVGIGTTSPTERLHVSGNIKSTTKVISPIFDINSVWTIESSGTELHFKQGGTIKARMLADGFVYSGEIAAYSTGTGSSVTDFVVRSGIASQGISTKLAFIGTTYPQIIGNGTQLVLSYSDQVNTGTVYLVNNALRRGASTAMTLGEASYLWENTYTDKITLGNGWTIEQTSSSLTIKRNGVVKSTINA